MENKKKVSFFACLLPLVVAVAVLAYGLGIRPVLLGKSALPLEVLMFICILFVTAQLLIMRFSWGDIENGMSERIKGGAPTFLVMLSIGLMIGTWLVSGTIPYMIHIGMHVIAVKYIYVIAFLLTSFFSLCTGTSWGSAASIGVVLIGIGHMVGANMPVLAAAVISGSLLGDKMSPLSETTNLAANVSGVSVYDHVGSMAYSMIPSAAIASVMYLVCGFIFPAANGVGSAAGSMELMQVLESAFHMTPWLLLPVAFVLICSVMRMPAVLTMCLATLISAVQAFVIQGHSAVTIFQSMKSGFTFSMTGQSIPAGMETVLGALERGGIYDFASLIITGVLIFAFVGCLDVMDAMPVIVGRLLGFAKTRFTVVASTLGCGFAFMCILGHVSASILLTADIFYHKYDEIGLSRRVLSRSLEDSTTFTSCMMPWSLTAIYMVGVTGVSTFSYLPFLFCNFINLVLVLLYAATGWNCYGHKNEVQEAEVIPFAGDEIYSNEVS